MESHINLPKRIDNLTIKMEDTTYAINHNRTENIKCLANYKKFLIIQWIVLVSITMLLTTPNIKLLYDIRSDLEFIEKLPEPTSIQDINKSIFSLAEFIDKKVDNLPVKNLEEKIFKLIFNKFYKKNNTILVANDNNTFTKLNLANSTSQ